jgi:bifunctional non-homologous end joining protein LigD
MIPVTGASGGSAADGAIGQNQPVAPYPRGGTSRVQPIIPTWRKEPFDDPEWLFEFKYDGFRALCYIEQGRCRLISRNGNVLSRFEALGEQVAAVLDVDEAVIDGEVIAVDESDRPQFYELIRVPRGASYVAFDILWLNGTDLRALPLTERRQSLQGIVPKGSPIVSEAPLGRGQGARTLRADVHKRPRRYRRQAPGRSV